MLGIMEAPEHATEMTHSKIKTTLKFLQCSISVAYKISTTYYGKRYRVLSWDTLAYSSKFPQ